MFLLGGLEDKPSFQPSLVMMGCCWIPKSISMNKGESMVILIKNGRAMDPKSGLDQVCDVFSSRWENCQICT